MQKKSFFHQLKCEFYILKDFINLKRLNNIEKV